MSYREEKLWLSSKDLIIHFQQISRAAALYIRALLGGVKRTLEVYRRVDDTTKNYPWSVPTTEEKWHIHAEGVLMVALTLNLPAEAWKSARLIFSRRFPPGPSGAKFFSLLPCSWLGARWLFFRFGRLSRGGGGGRWNT